MKVVMDTNALMMPVECDVRVFEELERLVGGVAQSATETPSGDEPRGQSELLVPEAVLDELAKLADGAGEEATAASVGLDLARDRCESVAHDEDYADDAVLALAERDDVSHAVTNDGPLKRRLLDASVPVISLRAENKLTVTQP
ncbi:PIN domain-containing protein [Halosimplex salinum]|uniref:PIN domain-containing protein n=1 Tax=Halosimplex salinum TaxID=1710538 RepID=UPI000F494D54|nr:twitching motility protein PilT [Halosimplex salinum]